MARCPFALWKPVNSHGSAMTADLGCVMHVTTNHGDPWGWFADGSHQASSHFWIADDGTLEQYIDTALASWAQAAGNHQYVSVETSGTPDQPLTDAELATFGKLYRWGHDTHSWPYTLAEHPGDKGFGWHGMGGQAWGGHFGCPGDLRKNQRGRILALAVGSTVPVTPPPPAPTPTPFPFTYTTFKDDMNCITVNVPGLDGNGHGYTDLDGGANPLVPAGHVISVRVNTAGYAPVPSSPGDEDFGGHARIEWVGPPNAHAFSARVWAAVA